jgi:hypothetical protein
MNRRFTNVLSFILFDSVTDFYETCYIRCVVEATLEPHTSDQIVVGVFHIMYEYCLEVNN